MKTYKIKSYFHLILFISIPIFTISCGFFPGTGCGGSEINFGDILLEESSNDFFAKNGVPTSQTFVDINGNKRRYTRSKNVRERFNKTLLVCEDADQLRYARMTGERRKVKFTSSSQEYGDDSYNYNVSTNIVNDKEGNLLVIDLFSTGYFVFITSFREHENMEVFTVSTGSALYKIGVPLPEFHTDTTILNKTFSNVYHSAENDDILFSEGVGVVALIDKNVLWVLDI